MIQTEYSAAEALASLQQYRRKLEREHGVAYCTLEGSGEFVELCKLLPLVQAEDIQTLGEPLGSLIPELKPLLGFDQRSPHHAYDLFTHVSHVVAGVPADVTLRWAALLHDIGKIPTFTQDTTGRGHFYGHAQVGARMAEQVLTRLQAPESLREQVSVLIENHMTKLKQEKAAIRQQVDKLGWETVNKLLYLQEADMTSKGVDEPLTLEQFPQLRAILNQMGADEP